MHFSLIAAADSKMGIGKAGKLPWHLPKDFAYFQKTTIGNGNNAVIMGRLTWESIPKKERPLKKRKNIVITRNKKYGVPQGVEAAESLEAALSLAAQSKPDEIFVIGGSQIFDEAISNPLCATIYLTEVEGDFLCDAFFPKIAGEKFNKISEGKIYEENGVKFRFAVFRATH